MSAKRAEKQHLAMPCLKGFRNTGSGLIPSGRISVCSIANEKALNKEKASLYRVFSFRVQKVEFKLEIYPKSFLISTKGDMKFFRKGFSFRFFR
jgi:hypothetical protein